MRKSLFALLTDKGTLSKRVIIHAAYCLQSLPLLTGSFAAMDMSKECKYAIHTIIFAQPSENFAKWGWAGNPCLQLDEKPFMSRAGRRRKKKVKASGVFW